MLNLFIFKRPVVIRCTMDKVQDLDSGFSRTIEYKIFLKSFNPPQPYI